MAGLMVVLLFVGSFFGKDGLIFALVFGSIMNLGAYWFSDKIVLKMSGAKAVSEVEAPELYRAVHDLALQAELPMPKVYLLPMPTPNAFATGRGPANAAVAVSPALIQSLTTDELKGVLAHELAHIKNRDVLIATVAACVAGAISYLAHMAQWGAIFGGRNDNDRGHPLSMLVMALVAPIAALLIQMAISRSREYAADASAARLTKQPLSLANALRKIHVIAEHNPVAIEPAMASLYIANPLTGRSFLSWFSTHPSLKDRIARLEAMTP